MMEIQARDFNSMPSSGPRWAVNLEGVIVEISEVVLVEIRANPT